MKGAIPLPCGQCIPCRVARRRVWTHRLMLEAETTADSCFVTLTYRDAPVGPVRGNLSPRDAILFLKRLRKALYPVSIRYYLVGEYGDQTFRPHYHAALFGIGAEFERVIEQAWNKGFVSVAPLCPKTCAYVVGYVVKKMTARDDPRLAGRHPEFARMSTHPGLGAAAVSAISAVGFTSYGASSINVEGDVPAVLRQGQTLMPLGRYLRGKLRLEHGADSPLLPPAARSRWLDEVFAVRRCFSSPAAYRRSGVWLEEGKAVKLEGKVRNSSRRRL